MLFRSEEEEKAAAEGKKKKTVRVQAGDGIVLFSALWYTCTAPLTVVLNHVFPSKEIARAWKGAVITQWKNPGKPRFLKIKEKRPKSLPTRVQGCMLEGNVQRSTQIFYFETAEVLYIISQEGCVTAATTVQNNELCDPSYSHLSVLLTLLVAIVVKTNLRFLFQNR